MCTSTDLDDNHSAPSSSPASSSESLKESCICGRKEIDLIAGRKPLQSRLYDGIAKTGIRQTKEPSQVEHKFARKK